MKFYEAFLEIYEAFLEIELLPLLMGLTLLLLFDLLIFYSLEMVSLAVVFSIDFSNFLPV